ncbi:MAG: electron transfer flavoprotein subunit alpha [Candidatus Omnitrophica bacterium]|nr:electron transfer flavoprotein subunit alpha [Candidatus Omnitrophota bacterium]
MSIEIIEKKCVGCGLCLKSCPYEAIELKDKIAVINDNCTLCGACVESCKFEAILLRVHHDKTDDLSKYRGVWVFAEQKKGIIQSVTHELLGEGRKLADSLDTELCAVLIGEGVEAQTRELIQRGADKVYLVEAAGLKDYLAEPYTEVMTDLINEYKPEIVLCGASSIGRSLIPRVAIKLKTGLTADCTGLEIDQERRLLLQTRPAFGGNIMADIICPDNRPQMATVRHKVMKEAQIDTSRTGEVIRKEPEGNALKSRTKLLDIVEDLSQKINIAEADIIVSGGRGIGKADNFKIVEDLAQVLGAAVGASRGAVDSDWIPYSHQVGQTGKTVCPKIYIACGISGQIQHLVGMQSADIIIAINKDPEAPIFTVADYGIVGDLNEVLPALTTKFKQVLGK